MDADLAIATIVTWLDNVHVETAQARLDEARGEFLTKLPHTPALYVGAPGSRLCIHEASHAVAAHFGGLGVARVCVLEHGGGCEYGSGDESFERRLASTVADLTAVFSELHIGADDARRHQLAHSPDVLQARLRLDTLRADGVSSRVCVTLAACLALSRWAAIVRVATVLGVLGELGAAEVAALAQGAQ